jgi:hypothetical protein
MKRFTLLSALLLSATSLLFGQDTGEPTNLFSYGIGLSTEYENDSIDSSDNGGGVVYSVQPQIALRVSRPRWETNLDYLPAFTYSPQSGSQHNAVAHSVGFAFSRYMSKRLRFDLESSFNLTNNPFDEVRITSLAGEDSTLDTANTTNSGEVLSRRAGHAGMELVYTLSKRSTVGGGASFRRSDYRENTDVSFDGSHRSVGESAHFYYSRRIGPRASTGFRYAFQKIDFGRGEFKTDSHSVLYTLDFDFTPTLSLDTFVGPDYSDSRSRSLAAVLAGNTRSRALSTVGGATFGWKGQHHGLSLSAIRRISDGGGAQGNVRLDSFSIYANRQLSRNLGINGFAAYNRNHLLLPVAGSAENFNYLNAGAGLERRITQNVSLNLFYWHVRRSDGQSAGFRSGNRVGIRLAYSQQRPLGK